MKKFNLEKALSGEPVVTRDGRKVLKIAYFETLPNNNCVIAHIKGNLTATAFTKNGLFGDGVEARDLFMATKTVTKYVGWFEYEGNLNAVTGDSEQEVRDKFKNGKYILLSNGKSILLSIVPNTFEI